MRSKEIPSEKTDFGPGKTPLYYHNKGLFSDPFIEDRLPNLEKYSSHPSTKYLNKYWNVDEFDSHKFNKAFQDIVDLWEEMEEDVAKYCDNEAQLEEHWIKPIFKILGWTYEVQDKIEKRGKKQWPDYSLFANADARKKAKNAKAVQKFFHATSVADAKAWDISLDGKGYTNQNPSFQIVTYMELTKKDWGILTNGREWRIYSLRSDSKHTTYYEIDLINILATKDYERFKYFYNFFRMEAFLKDSKLSDRCFLDFVYEDGQFYSQRIEQNLQAHAYKVVDTICQGFLENIANPSEEDLENVYEYSMYYLFKLMFVLNCESKGLLEVNKQDDYYEFSLRKKVLELKDQFEKGKNWSSQPRTYNYVNDLYELLKYGDDKIGVHGFGSEPFEVGSMNFYTNNKISDEYLNNALIELACSFDEEDNLQFIDYKILSPDHIGSLFEGLLEFDLVKKGKRYNLVNTKGERKRTGSYYTPEHMVDYIVEETLAPVLTDKRISDILKLKILDPSMGSGHFLLGVLRYIENHIVEVQTLKDLKTEAIQFDEIGNKILENCIYGIDINSLAAQLAKFSLWIFSSQKGQKLVALQNHLLNKDSLADNLNWEEEFDFYSENNKFDIVIGNPPYLGESGNKDIFRKIKAYTIGKEFYYGKMDLFYFFYHLALNKVKENGRIGMITTNYFITADGAKKLRGDLHERAVIDLIVNFNKLKVFKDAQGQHNMIMILNKSKSEDHTTKTLNLNGNGKLNKEKFFKLLDETPLMTKVKDELFDGNEYRISLDASTDDSNSIFKKILKKSQGKLGALYEIKQGVVSGCDKLTKKSKSEFNIKAEEGEGIFVFDLKNQDDRNLLSTLSKDERKLLKPFYKNSDIDYFWSSSTPTKKLVYLDRDIEAIANYPQLKKHLNRFKSILNSRREVQNGRISYFHLQWPRGEETFEGEKIVVPYRNTLNTFGYNNEDWFCRSDSYVIKRKENSPFELQSLLGFLNSSLVYFWLFYKGKRKGEILELFNTPLSEIPLPDIDNDTKKELFNIASRAIKKNQKSMSRDEIQLELTFEFIDEIDEVLFEYFGFTASEKKEVMALVSRARNLKLDTEQSIAA